MNIGDILRDYLEANGYDGLHNGGGCYCSGDDLMSCGEPSPECMPGHYGPANCSACELRESGVCETCDKRAIS
jgi:hypothetical protein